MFCTLPYCGLYQRSHPLFPLLAFLLPLLSPDILVDWSPPIDNGLPILRYEIRFRFEQGCSAAITCVSNPSTRTAAISFTSIEKGTNKFLHHSVNKTTQC